MRIPIDNSRADPRFVHKWLATPIVRDYIEGRAKGTSPTMKKISQSVVANIPFPTSLSLARQSELSRLVEKVWDRAAQVRADATAITREMEQLDDLLLEESFQSATPA